MGLLAFWPSLRQQYFQITQDADYEASQQDFANQKSWIAKFSKIKFACEFAGAIFCILLGLSAGIAMRSGQCGPTASETILLPFGEFCPFENGSNLVEELCSS